MDPDYNEDRRLDIVIFGPMTDGDNPDESTVPIHDAVRQLLAEDAIAGLLVKYQITKFDVHIPDRQEAPEIVDSILELLDTADLVIFNINQKEGRPDRANTFYELGIVHSLGIPTLLVASKGCQVPFYARTIKQYRVPTFEVDALAEVLRPALVEFLDLDERTTSFTNDRVSGYYGMPIVDISAAVGIATGYYYNFLSRLLEERGLLAFYPEMIRKVVYVRPLSVRNTYQADKSELEKQLANAGHKLETTKLEPPLKSGLGPIWFDHVDDIVIDLPRMIYPLQRSPRLLTLNRRTDGAPPAKVRMLMQRISQVEEALLDRVEMALRYQMRHDGTNVRQSIFHATTIDDVGSLVSKFKGR